MSLDLYQILNIFKFNNNQLKMLLVISVALLLFIFSLGKNKGNAENKLNTIEENLIEIKQTQASISNDILKNRLIDKAEITKSYKEMLQVQELDKKIIDSKLDLIIKYSVKSKVEQDNIKDIFLIIDNSRNSDVAKIISDINDTTLYD